MKAPKTTVCIVGAGPAGLVTAIGLARSGVPFVLLDADDGPTVESRALTVHAGALEVFEELGVAATLLDEGLEVSRLRIAVGGRTLADIPMDRIGGDYPFTLNVRQQSTEAALYARLAELGHTPLALHTVTGVRASGDGYEVFGRTAEGEGFAVRARYVVGADGVASVVRKAVGIDFPSRLYEQSFLIADVELENPLPDPGAQHICPSRHGLLFYAALPGGSWRLVVSVKAPGGRKPRPPTEDDLRRYIEQRGSGGLRMRSMISSSSFLFQHGIAAEFVRGGVALIGDAAHIHSPAGGMGLNTGAQDGYDLAATLASITRGADADEALAGFEQRRRAAGHEVVKFSDRMMVLITMATPVAHVLRTVGFTTVGRIAPLRQRIARMTSCVTRTPWRTGAPELPAEPAPSVAET